MHDSDMLCRPASPIAIVYKLALSHLSLLAVPKFCVWVLISTAAEVVLHFLYYIYMVREDVRHRGLLIAKVVKVQRTN